MLFVSYCIVGVYFEKSNFKSDWLVASLNVVDEIWAVFGPNPCVALLPLEKPVERSAEKTPRAREKWLPSYASIGWLNEALRQQLLVRCYLTAVGIQTPEATHVEMPPALRTTARTHNGSIWLWVGDSAPRTVAEGLTLACPELLFLLSSALPTSCRDRWLLQNSTQLLSFGTWKPCDSTLLRTTPQCNHATLNCSEGTTKSTRWHVREKWVGAIVFFMSRYLNVTLAFSPSLFQYLCDR